MIREVNKLLLTNLPLTYAEPILTWLREWAWKHQRSMEFKAVLDKQNSFTCSIYLVSISTKTREQHICILGDFFSAWQSRVSKVCPQYLTNT